jgi:hypothetical protein
VDFYLLVGCLVSMGILGQPGMVDSSLIEPFLLNSDRLIGVLP